MKPYLRIDNIADHPDLIETVAQWHYAEWRHLRPGSELREWVEARRRSANRWHIPMGFIALDGEEPQASASLVDQDLETRRDLWPWLAGVYVRLESRRQGIGATLVRHAVTRAGDMGIRALYLYTRSMMPFYERLGWRVVNEELYRGGIYSVMSIDPRRGDGRSC